MIDLVQANGYLGALIVSFIGNVSIFFPIPYALVIFAFGSVLNPLILGITAGVGCTIGEMSSYILGGAGRKFIISKYGSRLDSARRLIGRYGPIIIFLTALLPIPDDLLLIPLGIIKYSWWKTAASMLAGKTILCLILAYSGLYSFNAISSIFVDAGILGALASIVLLIGVVIILLKVDWEKVADQAQARVMSIRVV